MDLKYMYARKSSSRGIQLETYLLHFRPEDKEHWETSKSRNVAAYRLTDTEVLQYYVADEL